MPGFGLIKKLRSKTLGSKGRKGRRLQNENGNGEDEFMGFGFLDSLIELRYDVTDTTGLFGDRWKNGESMIGKFLNKEPETWPPEETEEETGGMGRSRKSRSSLDKERAELRAERQKLQQERSNLAGGSYGRLPEPRPPGEEQMGIDFDM